MRVQPNADEVRRVVACGAGAMGSQIGAVFALAGYETTVQDIYEAMLDRAR
jgi:3-hydroxybutyryl-CoA dehydrogenase